MPRDNSTSAISSNVITHPSSYSSLSPSSMKRPISRLAPSFDILSELSDPNSPYNRHINRDSLVQSTIYYFPSDIRTAIDRIRSQSDKITKPSVSRILTISITHGLETFSSHPEIISFCSMRNEFNCLQNVDSLYYREAESMLSHLNKRVFIVNDSSTEIQKRQNISLSSDLHDALTSLASDLGMQLSPIIVICCMITLSTQWPVFDSVRESMDRSIQSFFTRVQLRNEFARTVIDKVASTAADDDREGGDHEEF